MALKVLQKILAGGLLLPVFGAYGQFSDAFSDNEFLNNPTWTGQTADWVVNAEQQLQSNHTIPNSNFYLSTPNSKALEAQWDFWIRLNFNPSGANYTDVYLTASQSNITLSNTTGYFVRIGDTPDEISLYRKDANGSSVKIIDGTDGLLNTGNNILRIRVTRNAAHLWTLSRDAGGVATGTFVPEGTATDATHTVSAYFGIWVRQSTASFFQRHYFDDFSVKDFIPDNTPPALLSAQAVSPNLLEVLFNEPLLSATAANTTHYFVNNGVGNPASAVQDITNPSLVRLTFSNGFPNGSLCELTVNGVRDLAGNTLTNGRFSFLHYTPQRYDIVMNELMIDPLPQVGLPDANWIELLNTSAFPINLQGFRLGRTAGLSGPIGAYIMNPGEIVLICTGSAIPVLSPYGTTLAVTSFPSLPNAGDLVWLQDASGKIMHAVSYELGWYQNAVKVGGGWSLEMVDAKNPCSGSANWRASNQATGGTPGRANSVAANNRDLTAPGLISAFAPNANTLQLVFTEPLDSAGSVAPQNFTISNGIGSPVRVSLDAPLFTTATLQLANALTPGTIYTVTATGVKDCAGNTIGPQRMVRTGLAQVPDSLDLIVNEILFNPKPQGVDYLEVYNRSNKILNAGSIYFTNRNSSTGGLGTLYPLNPSNRLLFPGEFYVVTENAGLIRQQFTILNPDAIVQVPTMPSFPDDKGTVVLLNQTGLITDELNYDRRWHFALVDNEEGIALERIDYDKRTQLPDNWTSAAASAGFGTPGYTNSQFRTDITAPTGNIVVNPQMFSPDNDGFDDFCLIAFTMNEPGYVANVTIYDAGGRPVRILQRNTTIAASGSFRWDGLNDKQQRVATGNHIVLFEVFNLQGKKQSFKKAVTVARKF